MAIKRLVDQMYAPPVPRVPHMILTATPAENATIVTNTNLSLAFTSIQSQDTKCADGPVFNGASTRPGSITVKRKGIYALGLSFMFAPNATAERLALIYVNGSIISDTTLQGNQSAWMVGLQLNAVQGMAVNDVVTAIVYQASGVTLGAAAGVNSTMSAVWLGPN
jgi:hypothetical protein